MEFSDIRTNLVDEVSVSDPHPYASWDLDELWTPTTLDLESSWNSLDSTSPVLIGGTSIPRATNAKNTDLMARYLLDQGRHGFNVGNGAAPGGVPGGFRREPATDPSGYVVSPTYGLPPHFARGVGHVGGLTSPTTSGADDHSGPDMGSSYNGAWSDRASDGGPMSSHLGGGRPSDATTPTLPYRTATDVDQELFYGRPQYSFLPSQIVGAGAGGGGSLSTAGRDPAGFINPRQVQQDLSPIDNRPRPEETAGAYPVHHYPYPIPSQPEPMSYGPISQPDVGRRATEASIGSVETEQHPSPANSGSNSHPRSPSVRSTRELSGPTRPGKVSKSQASKNKALKHCTEHPQLSFKTASDWK